MHLQLSLAPFAKRRSEASASESRIRLKWKMAELICTWMPSIEKVRMVNSGNGGDDVLACGWARGIH